MSDIQIRAVVTGRVQGVFYRRSTEEQAHRLSLSGTVRNLDDGGVEIVVRGPSPQVEQLLAWARRGPPAAKVEHVSVEEQKPSLQIGRFRILRD